MSQLPVYRREKYCGYIWGGGVAPPHLVVKLILLTCFRSCSGRPWPPRPSPCLSRSTLTNTWCDLYLDSDQSIWKDTACIYSFVAFWSTGPLHSSYYLSGFIVCMRVCRTVSAAFIFYLLFASSVPMVAVRRMNTGIPADDLTASQLFGAGKVKSAILWVQFLNRKRRCWNVRRNLAISCWSWAADILKAHTGFAPQFFPHPQSRNAAHVPGTHSG